MTLSKATTCLASGNRTPERYRASLRGREAVPRPRRVTTSRESREIPRKVIFYLPTTYYLFCPNPARAGRATGVIAGLATPLLASPEAPLFVRDAP